MISKQYKLKEVAYIYSGYPFKGSPPFHGDGEYALVSPGDIKSLQSMYILTDSLPRIEFQGTTTALAPGDILVSNRIKYMTAIMPPFHGTPVIAREFLTIIRAKKAVVIPEFLYMKMSQKRTAARIESLMSGKTTKFITAEKLREITLSVPSKKNQQDLVDTYILMEKLKIAYQKKFDYLDFAQEKMSLATIDSVFEREKPLMEDALLRAANLSAPIERITREMKRGLSSLGIKN
jgi:hypothetical protein